MEPAAYAEMAQQQDSHWWFVGRRRILRSVIARLGLPPQARILEVGAGTGGNLAMLAEFGQVQAVEMDDFARSLASRRAPGVEVRGGCLPDRIPFAPSSFDLVCLFDVLEHVEPDVESLAALRALLAPGGCALITVPAYRWMWSRHDERLHHVRRYTKDELATKATAAGWKLRRITHFNALLLPLAVVARLADRLREGGATPSGTGTPVAPVNAALMRVFAAESRWLARADLPLGLSLLAVLDT
jgi:SAM-dependent methyltransferase